MPNNVSTKVASTRRGHYSTAIFQQSRAEVGPNSYARGDHIRPCFTGQRSLKRELLHNGKTNHIPGRTLPIRRGCRLEYLSDCVGPDFGLFPHAGDAAYPHVSRLRFPSFFPHARDTAHNRHRSFNPLMLIHPTPSPPYAEMGLSLSPCDGVVTPPQYFSKVGLRWARTHTPVETAQDPAMRGDGH